MKVYDISKHSNWYDDITKCKLIGETDAKVEIYSVIKIKNKYYRVGSVDVNEDGEYCGVKPCKKFDIDNEETSLKNMATCPICGHTENDSSDLKDIHDDYQCACGAILEVERNYKVTYSAKVVQLPKIYE